MPVALRPALVALAGGAISFGLVLTVETGSLFRMLLLGLAPLPLFASGLSSGWLSCLTAGLTGGALVTAALGSTAGALYLAAAAVPIAILVWQSLRRIEAGNGKTVWYTGGYLLLWLAGLGVTGVLAVIAYFVREGGLVLAIAERFDLSPVAAAMAARIAPGLIMALWTAVIAVDGVVAEWLVARSGWAIREPIDIRRLSLPLWIGPVLMVAGLAGAALREGTIGIICLSSAIVLVVPFAFLGLALLHALAGKIENGRILVVVIYVVLLGSPAVLGWRALLNFALLLAGLGSVDQMLDLRDMRGLRSGMKRK
jgi:hypothetical protein